MTQGLLDIVSLMLTAYICPSLRRIHINISLKRIDELCDKLIELSVDHFLTSRGLAEMEEEANILLGVYCQP